MITESHSIALPDYVRLVEPTDRLSLTELQPVLLGLFGEVGSIMATAKKLHREGKAYIGYRRAVIEEFGDALWYLTAICRRLGLAVDSIFAEAVAANQYVSVPTASDLPEWPIAIASCVSPRPALDPALLELGKSAAALLSLKPDSSHAKALLMSFAGCYLNSVQAAGMSFAQIADFNLAKTRGRFLPADPITLPQFDDTFEEEERIPEHFEITITERKSGKSYMQWNGVFIGDPLTDNIHDKDGYRFHDVFHFAHASVLHWSPTFRALIKHKRKSDPKIDETQDCGRAIVVEEGLTAWIFSCAKELGYFENQRGVSFDMLKTIQQFVSGYEVEACPLNLWEDAILQGYEVFRQVRDNNGGTIIGDRRNRKISYQPQNKGARI